MSNNVSIILSTYNEKLSIEFTITELIKNLPGCEIVVVDDNSPDGTYEVLKNIKNENLKIFSRKKTKGLASAFSRGLIETTGTIKSMTPKGDMIVLEVIAKNEDFDSEHGASIAINGCCLTVTEFHKNKFFFDVSIETINKTNLSEV